MKAAAIGRSAVGVNADDRVGAQPVGHRGPLIDAGSQRVVIAARHGRAHTELSQFRTDAQHHVPVEAVFGITGIGGRSRRLAFLCAAAPVDHLPVDRGVIGAVVTGIQEHDRACDTGCRTGSRRTQRCCQARQADEDRRRCSAFEHIAPRHVALHRRNVTTQPWSYSTHTPVRCCKSITSPRPRGPCD